MNTVSKCMKHRIALVGSLLLSLAFAWSSSAEPVKVIFDTDMITDFDDVGALACLHALADAGECEILATVSCTRGNASTAAIGVINGGMVATIGIPALIATFASQTVFQGIAYLISGGRPIAGFSSDFGIFARWSIGPVPICALIMVFCFALGSFILNKTYFGRYFYAIGGNEEAAALSGIRVNRVKYLIYALSGLFAGLAGIVLLSRAGSAQSTVGLGLEFDVITCVVLGGVSVNGGIGRMSGVVAGVLIIGSLTNGMILMDVSEYTQMVVKGIVLAVAVGIDAMSKKRNAS